MMSVSGPILQSGLGNTFFSIYAQFVNENDHVKFGSIDSAVLY